MSHGNTQPVTDTATDTVVLKRQTWLNVGFFGAFPVVGAGLGLFFSFVPGWLTQLPDWVDHLPMIPGHEQFALLDQLSGPWFTGVLVALGVLAGIAFAVMCLSSTTWEISRDTLKITKDDKTLLDVPLHDIRSLHPEGGDIVVLGAGTEVLFHGEVEPSREALKDAAARFDLSWHDVDPFDADYSRWLDGDPELSERQNAILRTRSHSVEKGDDEDVASLSDALSCEGIVVRDVGKRQQWRRSGSPAEM